MTPFTRTLRALEADRFRGSLFGLLLLAGVLGAWVAWFFLSRVARYEVSDTARLEVDQAIHVVQAPIDGLVLASHLTLARDVRAGEVLVELDAKTERLQMQEEQRRLSALGPEIESLEAQAAATVQGGTRDQEATHVSLEEAKARYREGQALARLADDELTRLARLRSAGLIAEREYTQGKGESERRRAAAESLETVASRLDREQRTRDSDRDAQLRRLRADIQRLQGQQSTVAATIERLRYQIERRVIRAPVSGRLAEVSVLRVGGVVEEGQALGAIAPRGTLRVVAEFPPPAALGRIRAGQHARLRLSGFPWAQYGSIPATVANVASEIRDGRIRVELEVEHGSRSPIPLQHGLPGSIEVEVESIPPVTLALRAAGQLLTSTTSPFTQTP